MAHILIQSEKDPQQVIQVRTDNEGNTYGFHLKCGQKITDRGHFEDTVQAIEIHVDQC
jgi:diaminopimelate decarboxylase